MNKKKLKEITLKPIGIIKTPFKNIEDMPIQPTASRIQGTVEIYQDYIAGLKNLDGFSHIILIYLFHKSCSSSLEVKPFLDNKKRGVFATRAPKRPNPIGVSVVKLIDIIKNKIKINNVDILDGTPLLDIKPFIPKIDNIEKVKLGWLSENVEKFRKQKSDNRFK
jgi:tRNA (adenine37-N6)-methyltransferase